MNLSEQIYHWQEYEDAIELMEFMRNEIIQLRSTIKTVVEIGLPPLTSDEITEFLKRALQATNDRMNQRDEQTGKVPEESAVQS